jgi:serine/threonine protein phosphatase 1
MFRLRSQQSEPQRIYAIGDLHGRLDLFRRMISIIKRDHAERSPVPTCIVLLGDLIDRGPNSAELVHWCRELTETNKRFVVLKGNHEAMMVRALREGDFGVFGLWLEQGGDETLASWGVPRTLIEQGASLDLLKVARIAVTSATLEWMSALPLWARHQHFLFVHAGIRPGLKLKAQSEADLLTIRDDFIRSKMDHGQIVVHGHSIHEAGPDIQLNRIGIDSGAFRTGILTGIGIENGEVWPLMTYSPQYR